MFDGHKVCLVQLRPGFKEANVGGTEGLNICFKEQQACREKLNQTVRLGLMLEE